MQLYHGTTADIAHSIIEAALARKPGAGLAPRGKRKSNWAQASHPGAIYLTNAYAIFFATAAALKEGEGLAVLEIDDAQLDMFAFAPDEDYLEQVTRQHPEYGHIYRGNMKRRTTYFRNRAHTEFVHVAEKSLDHMGNIAYYGTIPAAAIKRIAFLDSDAPILRLSDPTITLANYSILGPFYRNLMRALFGDEEREPDPLFESRLVSIDRKGIRILTPDLSVLNAA